MKMKKKTKLIWGGGINDSDYSVRPKGKKLCKFYATWLNMLQRCYSQQYKTAYPTYANCSVVDEWLSFMAFRKWMIRQKWEGREIDKDLIKPGNKVYGPDTCCFVSRLENAIVTDRSALKGEHPVGVYFSKRQRKFMAQITRYGKRKTLGLFDTEKKAELSYVRARAAYIIEVAEQSESWKACLGLRRHAKLFDQRALDLDGAS
jgi:hypothetical protein